MPVFSALVLLAVLLVSVAVVVFAARERAAILREMGSVVSGIERRTEAALDAVIVEPESLSLEMKGLLDDAVQAENHQRAVLAVNELGGKAALRRTRAFLFSRGLPRVALLSGGGGALVVLAVGHFDSSALLGAAASVLIGLVGSFVCGGLNAATRVHAKKYVGIVEVLAREVERHFSPAGKANRNSSVTGSPVGRDL